MLISRSTILFCGAFFGVAATGIFLDTLADKLFFFLLKSQVFLSFTRAGHFFWFLSISPKELSDSARCHHSAVMSERYFVVEHKVILTWFWALCQCVTSCCVWCWLPPPSQEEEVSDGVSCCVLIDQPRVAPICSVLPSDGTFLFAGCFYP